LATDFYISTYSYRLPALFTGQLADKPTRGQSSRGLDNSQTGQLADSDSAFTSNIWSNAEST